MLKLERGRRLRRKKQPETVYSVFKTIPALLAGPLPSDRSPEGTTFEVTWPHPFAGKWIVESSADVPPIHTAYNACVGYFVRREGENKIQPKPIRVHYNVHVAEESLSETT